MISLQKQKLSISFQHKIRKYIFLREIDSLENFQDLLKEFGVDPSYISDILYEDENKSNYNCYILKIINKSIFP